MKTKFDFDPSDLTKGALVRLVKQLAIASDEEESKLLKQLDQAHKESNDLADLKEEKKGAPSKIDAMDETDDK